MSSIAVPRPRLRRGSRRRGRLADEVAEQRCVRPLAAVVGGDAREVEDRRLVRGREIERRGVDSCGIRDRIACCGQPVCPRGRSYAVARSASRSESAFMPHSLARRGRLRPGWGLVAQGGERGGGVKRGYSPVEAQVLRLCREAAGGECGLERAVLLEDGGGGLRPDSLGAGDLVRRVAAERDEVGHLLRLHAVELDDAGRIDPVELEHAAHGLEDRRPRRRELVGVAVGRDDEARAAPLLLRGGRRTEEVVGLVAGRARRAKAERLHELGQHRQLLEQGVVEHPSRLVAGKRLVPVRRRLERVPADDDRARLLGVPQAQQEVREADERSGRPAARARDRLRQPVVRAVREAVAVHRHERPLRGES